VDSATTADIKALDVFHGGIPPGYPSVILGADREGPRVDDHGELCDGGSYAGSGLLHRTRS